MTLSESLEHLIDLIRAVSNGNWKWKLVINSDGRGLYWHFESADFLNEPTAQFIRRIYMDEKGRGPICGKE